MAYYICSAVWRVVVQSIIFVQISTEMTKSPDVDVINGPRFVILLESYLRGGGGLIRCLVIIYSSLSYPIFLS